MRKEQTLLLVSAIVGGLLVWSSTAQYAPVGAADLPEGSRMDVTPPVVPNITEGVRDGELAGRSVFQEKRLDRRPPLPEVPSPLALPFTWVRPVTSPGPGAQHWSTLRHEIVAVAPAPVDPNAPATEPDEPVEESEDTLDQGKMWDPTQEAQLVSTDGTSRPVELTIVGALKGQPDWVVLERWPDIDLLVAMFKKPAQPVPMPGPGFMGIVPMGPAELANYQTVHLKKNLLNEYHEERIRRRLGERDRAGWVEFARWTFETLRPKYSVEAVRLAIDALKHARELGNDMALTRLLGEYYRAAYDLEGEIATHEEFLSGAGNANDADVLVLLGDTFERAGAFWEARTRYEKAAQAGDSEARVRLGNVLIRLGELDVAFEEFRKAQSAASKETAAGALLGMARVRLARGQFDEALTLAQAAQRDGALAGQVANVLGAVQYALTRFADAEKSFGVAVASGAFAGRTNHGFALLALGRLDEAQTDFQTARENEPLNLFDPLYGIGSVHQHKGELDRSNDTFETARQGHPQGVWILVRLGTARLRDGQPEKAGELGRAALDVVPGCVEALRLVGLAEIQLAIAAAAVPLEAEDTGGGARNESDKEAAKHWEEAIRHLRRALQKEPGNRSVLYEYVVALIRAGRLEEALRVVEEATNETTGIARGDARLYALLAYARFLGRKPMEEVYEALDNALRKNPDKATETYVRDVRGIISEWDRTREWVDEFDRPAGSKVANQWEEHDEAHGIGFGLVGDRVKISGRSKGAAPTRNDATRMWKVEELIRFKAVESTFKINAGTEFVFHVVSGTVVPDRQAGAGASGGRRAAGGSELGLGCDRNGNLVLWRSPPKKGEDQAWIVKDAAGADRKLTPDEWHTVEITRVGEAVKGQFEIYFDGELVPGQNGETRHEIGALSASVGKTAMVGFLVDAEQGAVVDGEIDRVKITKTTGR